MPLLARRLVRKMRGGAQAHLIEASDGNFYVVKFKNNPQHRRILINETIATALLDYLQVSTPETAVIELNREFLEQNPEVHIQLGSHRVGVEPGWHFGSRYPGDPATMVVYDFIPDALLGKVENLAEFLGALVFDKWTANADSRQSIFFRARLREGAAQPETGLRLGFWTVMLDHGYIFNGPHWDFADSPLAGLYFRPFVYARVRSLDDFEPWLERVVHFPDDVLDKAVAQVPPEWLDGSGDDLERLLEQLLRRRKRVATLIEDCRKGRIDPFPNWK